MNDVQLEQLVKVSGIIDLIYDSAQSPERWPDLLMSLDEHFQQFDMNNVASAALSEQSSHLTSHLFRSMQLSQEHSQLNYKQDISSHIFDQLPIGFIVANAQAEIVAMNRQARESIESSDVISINNNIIATASRKKTALLHERIHALASSETNDEGFSLRLTPPSSQHAISIWVAALDAPLNNAPNSQRLVSLYIISPFIKPKYDIDILQKHFCFTPAETRLTKTITNGCHSLVDAAEHLDVSIHTVRNQMKSIFAKTNCSSQVELIKVILTSPVMIRQPATKPAGSMPVNGSPRAISSHVRLYDGRRIGYMEYGNPHAEPLIYCHALVFSDKQLLPDETLQNTSDFRIIAPMRPGFLNSTWSGDGYSLRDCAEDVIQLTKALNIETFKVMGYSNGATYAASLAYYFPQRVISLTLVSPVVPPEFDNWEALSTSDRYILHVGKWLPFKAMAQLSKLVLHSMSKRPSELVDRNINHVSESEKIILRTDHLKKYISDWITASYPHRTSAVVYDLLVRIRPWGFLPQDISVPVQIWHAKDDSTVSVACAKAFASALPDARCHVLDRGGHYILFACFKDIIASIHTGRVE